MTKIISLRNMSLLILNKIKNFIAIIITNDSTKLSTQVKRGVKKI